MFSRFLAAVIAVLIWVAPQAAQARWLRAETQRFVVYSDGDERDLRAFAAKLTTFDQLLRLMHGVKDRELGRKLDVYLVRGREQLTRAAPGLPTGIVGLYRATPQGIYALSIRNDNGFGADDILFHEYTHHFMLEYFPSAYPAWLVEGYAEFYATADIRKDAIEVGRYNPSRAASLVLGEWMPLQTLLTQRTWQIPQRRQGAYYAQAWLLTHYMMTDPARSRQLDAAIRDIGAGKAPVEAMETATGLKVTELDNALHAYARGKLFYRRMANPFPGDPPMTVTVLPSSADQILLEHVALEGGVRASDGPVLLDRLRGQAKRFPGDALADDTLARAEIYYGDRTAGESILQRRLAADPKEVESLRLMGESRLIAGRRDAAQRVQLFKEARPFLAQAYAIDAADFRTLFAYAEARSIDPDYPTENTLNVLLLACQLAPSVEAIRLQTGRPLLRRGQKEAGIAMLTPLANSPHGGGFQLAAAKLVAEARGLQAPPDAPAPAAQDASTSAPTPP